MVPARTGHCQGNDGGSGGRISVRSALGQGAEFVVHLPPMDSGRQERGAALRPCNAMQPSVSVIVPATTSKRRLGRSERSPRADLSREKIEVVIADGLSTDGTRAAISRSGRRMLPCRPGGG